MVGLFVSGIRSLLFPQFLMFCLHAEKVRAKRSRSPCHFFFFLEDLHELMALMANG